MVVGLSNKGFGPNANADIYFEQTSRQSLARIELKLKTHREVAIKEKQKRRIHQEIVQLKKGALKLNKLSKIY